MAIDRFYSLSKAAKLIGCGRERLPVLLRIHLQIVLPEVPRGAHQMIPESVLERLSEKLQPRTNWTLLRTSKRPPHRMAS